MWVKHSSSTLTYEINVKMRKSKKNSSPNLKVTWWPCSSLLILRYQFLPVMTIPNKETATIVVKTRKSKFFNFLLKFDLDGSRSNSHMVTMCRLLQAFQIIKPSVDISSNGWDIVIYVNMTLTSISRSLLRHQSINQTIFTKAERPLRSINESVEFV